MKRHTLIFLVAFGVISLWLLIRHHMAAMRIAAAAGSDHVAEIIDNSTSQPLYFETVVAPTKAALARTTLGRKSRLTIFTLGSPASSWEPVPIFDGAAPRKEVSTFGGHSFEGDLKLAWAAGIAQVPASSIYRAVKVALDHLHGEGCGVNDVHGTLVVMSDGEENVTRDFLRGAGKSATLDNRAVSVTWCGYGVTDSDGAPRGERVEALLAKWRGAFTDPSKVVFKPFCEGTPMQTLSQGPSHAR